MANIDKNLVNSYVNNNYDRSGIDNINHFFGFNQNIYLDPAIGGFSFVFITKPCLYLYPQKPSVQNREMNEAYENLLKDPKLSEFIATENDNKKDQLLIKQLSYFDFNDVSSLFLPIFTNLIRSFTPMDTNLDTIQEYTTREGFNMIIPTTTTMSETSGNVSISISETSNFDVFKLLNIWVTYIKNISNGTYTANTEMIKNNMLDYTSSIYYFVLSPDGRTLKYWSRYTGCYPTSVPSSMFSYQKGSFDSISYDIPFVYNLKEEMTPTILEDFNMLSLKIVNPIFTDDNYDEFVNSTETEKESEAISYTNSKLLSKEKLFSGKYRSIVIDDNRDPIVFYEKTNSVSDVSGNIPGKYVLSFSKNTINYTYAQTLLNNVSAFDYDYLIDKIN